MKTIIVAVDFSPMSLNAADYATAIAKNIKAKLHLLHVCSSPQIVFGDTMETISVKDLLENGETRMAILKNNLAGQAGDIITIQSSVVLGDFFNELEDLCFNEKPYLVIMGCQGKTAIERVFLGSNTLYTMRNLNWPVLAVPPVAQYKEIKQIGLACDFSKPVDALPIADVKTILEDFNAQLHVINVGRKAHYNSDIVFESVRLDDILKPFEPKHHFIDHNDIDEAILEFMDTEKIDLLIILPKSHSLIERLVYKSSTKELSLHTRVPLLSLHQINLD